MAVKRLTIPEIGEVALHKRRGSRSIRMYIRGDTIKVTLPYLVSYNRALKFIADKHDWILQNRKPTTVFSDSMTIGKQHSIQIKRATGIESVRTRVTADKIVISVPNNTDYYAGPVQTRIQKAAERALLIQSKELLTSRVKDLAFLNGIDFKSISYKKMTGRWGSCDSNKNLTFNIYLIQLPWKLIDYVIIHELAHITHHNHSKNFWSLVLAMSPDFKECRKQIKQFHPQIIMS